MANCVLSVLNKENDDDDDDSGIAYLNGLDSMVQCLTGLNLICQIVCFRLNAQINSLNPTIAPRTTTFLIVHHSS